MEPLIPDDFSLEEYLDACVDYLQNNSLPALLDVALDFASRKPITKKEYQQLVPVLHQLFSTSVASAKARLFGILLAIDSQQKRSKIERYNFDYLIASQIERRPPDSEILVRNDKDKLYAIACAQYLINEVGELPPSIIRAFVCLADDPKDPYYAAIIPILLNCTVENPDVVRIPGVLRILMNELASTGSESLRSFICYAIEHRFPSPIPDYSISCLLNSLTCQSTKALIGILRTWPGLIHFGIICNGIKDVLLYEQIHPEDVNAIWKGVICAAESILDPYTGLLYYSIEQFGGHIEMPKKKVTANADAESTYSCKVGLQTGNISFDLPANYADWDWYLIRFLLTAILPYKASVKDTQSVFNFCSRLLEYFSSKFKNEKKHMVIQSSGAFLPLIRFIFTLNDFNTLLKNSTSIFDTISIAIGAISNTPDLPSWSPYWTLLEGALLMSTNNVASSFLAETEIITMILSLCSNCTNPSNTDTLISCIHFSEKDSIGSIIVHTLLNSANDECFQVTLNCLRKKDLSEAPFWFERVLVVCLCGNDISLVRKADLVGLMLETLTRDPNLSELITPACQSSILTIFPIVPLILSQESAPIEKWMDSLIYDYVDVFDYAVECGFEGKILDAEHYPSVFMVDGVVHRPLHLFSLLDSLPNGVIVALKTDFHKKSLREQRGVLLAIGAFGSNPRTSQQIEENDLVEFIISSTVPTESYVLLGTLINVLSQFHITKYFTNTIKKHNFILFENSSIKSVFPADWSEVIVNRKATFIDETVTSIGPELQEAIGALSNPLTIKGYIQKIQLGAERPIIFTTPSQVLQIHQILASTFMIPQTRHTLGSLIRKTPLMEYNHRKDKPHSEAIQSLIERVNSQKILLNPK